MYESMQNEVKRKMMKAAECNVAPRSPLRLAREKNHCDQDAHPRCSPCFRVRRTRVSKKTPRRDADAILRHEPSRTLSPSIMRDDFAVTQSLHQRFRRAQLKHRTRRGAQPWPVLLMW